MPDLETLLGAPLPVFLGLTVVLAGTAAFLSGQSVAASWKPIALALVYPLLLALASRFLTYALFGGPLLSLSGYVVDALVLMAFGVLGYRITLAHKMVCQYPWLYERAGLFTWRAARTREGAREKA